MKAFSLILAASHVPDGHMVYKVGGNLVYEITRDLHIYTKGQSGHQKISPAPGMVYLLNGSDINQIPDSTDIRLDFETCEELKDFVDELVPAPDEDK